MPTDWGLSLPNRGVLFGATTVEEMLELARTGEASGFFDSVWVGDSLLDRPRVEANVLVGALAAATSDIRLGVSCFASLVCRHPIELAVQWASLDVISGGRTIWVPCIGGGVSRELGPFGVERRERVARLKETVALVRRLWTEEKVDHDGRFYSFEGVSVDPKPVQEPHPPMWYAVTPDDEQLAPEAVDRALVRALEHADGWQGADTDATQIGRLCDRVGELARDRGLDGFPCSTHIHVTIDDDRDRAWEESRWYFDEYYPVDFATGRGPLPTERIRRMHTWGGPEECARGLQEYADAGCSTVIVRFASRDQQGQMRRFLDEVAPMLS